MEEERDLLGSLPGGRKLIGAIVVVGALLVPAAGQAAIPSALGIACTVQSDGVRFCSESPRSTVDSPVDGVPIDVNIAFPPAPASGTDGNYPLVMMFHGYGGTKLGLAAMHRWLDQGYATFSMSDRGFGESCGSPASRALRPAACANGYVRLIDNRYEVRDAQDFAGLLADEGDIDGQEVGAIGGSYGGGVSMALGALKNRVVDLDYSIHPWTSPSGKPMQIAAAAPNIPWTDLAYSLAPNGSTLDYVADAPYRGRPGVEKQSFITGLYLSGLAAPGQYAPPGTDPTADLITWKNRLDAGEPYGSDVQAILDEITAHHSSYYIDHSIPPAPMLMSSGFTDDLFPADETIRYYNRTKTQYPNADLGLFFGDFGHMRGQNKADVTSALQARENAWFDYFIRGNGAKPPEGVEAYTQTCPKSAPSGGPYSAGSWATIAPGEVRFDDPATKTIAAGSNTGGDFNPVTNSNPCASTSADDKAGAAVYKLDPAPAGGGYTMMGAVSVIADFTLPGDTSQVAARLLDVAPGGTETLVDRGLWRPASGGPTKQVFQLHPNGYNFAEGHVPKLELLAADGSAAPDPSGLSNYGRPSNNQQPVTVSNLELRLPVVEKPGSLGGLVKAPAKKFVPDGYQLAADFAALGSPQAKLAKRKLEVKGKHKNKRVIAKVSCPAEFASCNSGNVRLDGKVKKRHGGGKKGGGKKSRGGKVSFVANGSFDAIEGGTTAKVRLKLSRKARGYLRLTLKDGHKKHGNKHHAKRTIKRKLRVVAQVRSIEVDDPSTSRATVIAKKHRRHRGKKGKH